MFIRKINHILIKAGDAWYSAISYEDPTVSSDSAHLMDSQMNSSALALNTQPTVPMKNTPEMSPPDTPIVPDNSPVDSPSSPANGDVSTCFL